MSELLTSAQMRSFEQAAIAAGDVTGLELMERAGQGVVEAIFEEWPKLATTDHRAVVFCGPGNNGGDGFVVARLLKENGWDVNVLLYGDAGKLPPDAKANYERWQTLGTVVPLTEQTVRSRHKVHSNAFVDVYIDALFGTGLTRAVSGELFNVVQHLSGINGDSFREHMVSVDAPSGLCLDSGRVLTLEPDPTSVKFALRKGQTPQGPKSIFDRFAALTVTFDSAKVGHFLDEGPAVCGKVVVKDIGLENWRCFKKTNKDKPAFFIRNGQPTGALRPPKLELVGTEPLVPDLRSKTYGIPLRLRKSTGPMHKYTYGHALILSGGPGKTGAARLAARGALRIGAGLVTLGVPPSAQMEVAGQVTSIMLSRVADPDAFAEVIKDFRLNALCLGPALGFERARALVPVALRAAHAPYVVLDADALSAYADDPETLFEMLHEKCVLTPHGGEFARLFPDIAEKLARSPTKGPAYSKVDATREAAVRAGCVVLYKGPDTVIAAPDGQCRINSARYGRAAPWLATAGAGDVLAGFITGLLARGGNPIQAAETAAWLHVECARSFGPGLIAEDIPEELPKVFRELGL
jgi:ADP-dependent NAD(P)H-hydrate dehydratase / NAD(P)H-hydrate epimerase